MVTSTTEQLTHYQQLRAILRTLHNVLLNRLPRHAIEEGGKRLGIFRGGGLAFSTMGETSVLMDYCIYDYRWDGHNVIERYANEPHAEIGSDEKILLDTMLKARYSLFAIDEVVKGVGVQTRDLMRGDSGFIMDIAMSETAVKGLVLAGRIISPEGTRLSMTTGAALPADRSIMARVIQEIPEHFGQTGNKIALMSPETAAEFSASIIRIFLEGEASSRIAYEGPDKEETTNARPKVGRNEPCPCGSGKKFKKCCGKGG